MGSKEEGSAPEKRPVGRPPNAPDAGVSTVVYTPLDDGDSHTVEWHGLTFKANVPKKVNHATHAELLESAKGNPWFSVNGKQSKRTAPTAEPVPLAGSDVAPEALDPTKMVEAE